MSVCNAAVDVMSEAVVSDVMFSRRPVNKSQSRHTAAAAAAAAPVDSTNHVDTSLKTCVESLSAVRRLHKDLASHIEVCMSCVGCPLTTQGPCQSHRGVYVLY